MSRVSQFAKLFQRDGRQYVALLQREHGALCLVIQFWLAERDMQAQVVLTDTEETVKDIFEALNDEALEIIIEEFEIDKFVEDVDSVSNSNGE